MSETTRQPVSRSVPSEGDYTRWLQTLQGCENDRDRRWMLFSIYADGYKNSHEDELAIRAYWENHFQEKRQRDEAFFEANGWQSRGGWWYSTSHPGGPRKGMRLDKAVEWERDFQAGKKNGNGAD